MYQTGLVSVSFRSLSPREVIEAAVNANLKWIEWGSDVHAPCNDIPRLEEIAALQKEFGIACSSYGTYFRIGVNAAEELHDYIRAARILGTNILRLWCGPKGSADFTPEELEPFYALCRQLANIAENAGVILCMECHGGTLTDAAAPAYALMQAVDSPAFRMYYQPCQYRSFEDNIAYAKLLAPYTHHLHVFNWEGDLRFPLKDAIGQWQAYLSCFSGDRALLLEFMPDNRVESLPGEANALFEIVGGTL